MSNPIKDWVERNRSFATREAERDPAKTEYWKGVIDTCDALNDSEETIDVSEDIAKESKLFWLVCELITDKGAQKIEKKDDKTFIKASLTINGEVCGLRKFADLWAKAVDDEFEAKFAAFYAMAERYRSGQGEYGGRGIADEITDILNKAQA